jgi:SRSO17 transposase
MQAQRKNMERMAEVVAGANYQSLQQFLTDSPWDHVRVFDRVARDADAVLGGGDDTCLLLDESGFGKKGDKSVGVARQWNGRQGKVDNCQVGVFSALCRGDRATLVGARLYLPKAWTDDASRLEKAGVPEEDQEFRTKPDLALGLVLDAQEQGLRYSWVGADAFYGNDPQFVRALEDFGETFLVDVHSNQGVWLRAPGPGREAIRVDKWAAGRGRRTWKRVRVRDSTKGPIVVEAQARRMWLWDGKEAAARRWWLIVRRDAKTKGDLKYSLSNAPARTPLRRLARMQACRYWIERVLEDGKSASGLADYQVRGWRAWHHHVALVALAMLFMLKERVVHRESTPLLSCHDIEILLAHFLPRRDCTPAEALRQMKIRHRKRQAAIDSAHRRRRSRGS